MYFYIRIWSKNVMHITYTIIKNALIFFIFGIGFRIVIKNKYIPNINYSNTFKKYSSTVFRFVTLFLQFYQTYIVCIWILHCL